MTSANDSDELSSDGPNDGLNDLASQPESSVDLEPPTVGETQSSTPSDCDKSVEEGSNAGGLDEQLKTVVADAESRILESFDAKLRYDSFKEQQISKLHDELQGYKQGIANTTLKPFVVQVVRFLDQLPRHVQSLKAKPADKVTRERLFDELECIVEDLQMILENVGVEVFQSTEPQFDPRLQQARATVDAEDPGKHHVVAESMLSGYKLDGKIIEKERVKVFVYRAGNETTDSPQRESQPAVSDEPNPQDFEAQQSKEPGDE